MKRRPFRITTAKVSDEVIREEFWKNKTPQEKLEAAERIRKANLNGRNKNAAQRLRRIFRVTERS